MPCLAVKVLFMSLCLFLPQAAGAAQKELFTVGSAPLGGTYYPAAVGLAEIITKYVPGVEGRVEVTGGTLHNPVLMQQGELHLGLANADIAHSAYHGLGPFDGNKMSDLRALFIGLAPGVVQYVVGADSGISHIRDLKGKRVAVGPQGNSSSMLFISLLEFYGLSHTDVTMNFLSFSDGVNALMDGHVDMAIVQAGLPAPGLQEAFAGTKGIKILSFPEDDRDNFIRNYPYYLPMTITSAHYERIEREVITFATSNMVLIHAEVKEEHAYQITAAVFENLEEFRAAHPTIRSVTLTEAVDVPIPLHPGASRYFKEKGVLK
ncbi:MAG: TAXI family TRAP transporter solute-binding subunit [Deltaproteobacteria bacterium]|jgi:TRAP transporter TAXI family solute receptor|nr:TAXI family TRAP transporter solute-binding subunit [Deltaproteobacteria bacterium]